MTTSKSTFIYTLSDSDGNIRYIGKTSDLKKRLRDHIYESKKSTTYKNNWVRSLIKNNDKPIIEILDEVPSDEWEFWEIFYIGLFRSWGFNLTNTAIGGNGTGSGVDNPNYGRKLTLEHRKKCSDKLKGENNPFYGKTHNKESLEIIRKKVNQYSLNGEFIKTWKSIKDAEDLLKIHSISSCCNHKLLSAGGYVWRFYDNNTTNIKLKKSYRKPVFQYDLSGELIKKWNSVSEAQNYLKISHISKVCNNYKTHKTSGGYIWKYN